MGGEPEILDTRTEAWGDSGRTSLSMLGRQGCNSVGVTAALTVAADTKPQNYPAMHTGHEAIKRLLKCHLLNCRFQLINPHDLEVPGGQTFAIWPLELPCSLEGEPAL